MGTSHEDQCTFLITSRLLILRLRNVSDKSRRENQNTHLMLGGARGGVVVKALRYKLAGRGFDSRWCHWSFSVT